MSNTKLFVFETGWIQPSTPAYLWSLIFDNGWGVKMSGVKFHPYRSGIYQWGQWLLKYFETSPQWPIYLPVYTNNLHTGGSLGCVTLIREWSCCWNEPSWLNTLCITLTSKGEGKSSVWFWWPRGWTLRITGSKERTGQNSNQVSMHVTFNWYYV